MLTEEQVDDKMVLYDDGTGEYDEYYEGVSDLIDLVNRMDVNQIRNDWDWHNSRSLDGLGKSLPYYDKRSLESMQKIGFRLYRDANVQSAIESLVSYVVYKGWSFSVNRRQGATPLYTDSKLANLQAAHQNLVNEVSLGNLQGWYFLLDESYRRFLRDGEYFRRWWIVDDTLHVRFIEVYDIEQPKSLRNVVDLESLPEDVLMQISEADVAPGEFGVVTAPGDAALEIGYWHRFTERDEEPFYRYLPAAECQHAKSGVDANDPRGVPAFYDSVCHCVHVEQVTQAMNELAVKQSKYAVVHKHRATNRREAIKDLATSRARELNDQVSGRGRSEQETHIKGVDIEMHGMKAQAKNYIEVVQQGQRLIGGIKQVPEFMIANDANTGNRSSLLAAAGPFGRRVAREQKHMWHFDMALQWAALSQIMQWQGATTLSTRRRVQVSVSFPLPETKDPHKDAQTVIELRRDGAISRQEQRRMLDKDHEQMVQELEAEGGIEQVDAPSVGGSQASPTSIDMNP